MGASEFLTLLKAMESAVTTTGKAQPGDKTILDALHAAQESAARAVAAGKDLVKTVARAAGDAETAAQQTANIVCRVGRASKLGERALGHPDPGAVSLGIILRAISDWLQQNSVHPAS
jgi:dihydroxyacetone kinase